jgi:protease-4
LYIFLALVSLGIGFVIFDTAITRTKIGAYISDRIIARPTIGIVRLDTSISATTADNMVKAFRYARDNDAIKAVVFEIDSPGGDVTATEEIYLEVMRTRQEKPVVVAIGIGALSGGYYVAMGANYVYAMTTSFIGNIGVWITMPPDREDISEAVIPSGPFKSAGSDRRRATAWQEMVKQGFIRTVVHERGDKLRMSQEDISKAEIYIGMEALRNGLIDDIGTTSHAIERTAALAGITNYNVLDINDELDLFIPFFFFPADGEGGNRTGFGPLRDIVPQYHYMYRAPEAAR